ncbi:MAG: hypothetical protein DSY66_03005 [Persephonella sp.]|nr:MAG: hypothetical protein DSY53_02595 [Persephonella sp.]RUM61046.1 MAG: hypothetical protein DSY66_03005 [Persephonella sp.]
MFRKILFILLGIFLLSLSVFAKEIHYKSKVYGISVGDVVIRDNGDKIIVEGSTYRGLSWLYNYSFKFKAIGDKYYLYENENGKEKVYTNEKIYEKKAWLPILVDFIRYGKIRKNIYYPFKLKIEGNKYIIIPLKSKKVKKIEFTVNNKDRYPVEIYIDGKIDITIIREE